jgi:hypothetical protein
MNSLRMAEHLALRVITCHLEIRQVRTASMPRDDVRLSTLFDDISKLFKVTHSLGLMRRILARPALLSSYPPSISLISKSLACLGKGKGALASHPSIALVRQNKGPLDSPILVLSSCSHKMQSNSNMSKSHCSMEMTAIAKTAFQSRDKTSSTRLES